MKKYHDVVASQAAGLAPASMVGGHGVRRRVVPVRGFGVWGAAVLSLALLGLAGCATTSKSTTQPAPAVEALTELMARAEGFAAAPGGREQARDAYREAAKAYPTSKQPWIKLAESYFDAKDYGNAILAAQEVLEREPGDSTASGVLAVSGLRVSSQALYTLRTAGTAVNGSVKTEAQALATTLRTVLGEPVLVPRLSNSVAPEVEEPVVKPKKRVKRQAVAAQPANPVVPVVTTRPVTSNPFDKLK